MTRVFGIFRRLLSILVTVLLVLILFVNVCTLMARAVTGRQNTTVFGFSSAVVLTGSMSGAIEPNDMIITQSRSAYQVGDIIMYEGNTATVTHRIIEIQSGGYLTKGDANNTDDGAAIPPEKVIGKVILTIPQAGKVILFCSTPLGMLLLLLILFGVTVLPGIVYKKNT